MYASYRISFGGIFNPKAVSYGNITYFSHKNSKSIIIEGTCIDINYLYYTQE
jgi:hypothetical protein